MNNVAPVTRGLLNAAAYISAFVAVSGQAAAGEVLDLRTRTDATGLTEVSFCARDSPDAVFSLPGHAFVAFRDEADDTFKAVGHTTNASPTEAAFTYFSGDAVAGKQKEEFYTSLKQKCLTVQVDREIYEQAIIAARPTLTELGLSDDIAASSESYRLSGNDCMDFAIRVARVVETVGLKVPERRATDLPLPYIKKMQDEN